MKKCYECGRELPEEDFSCYEYRGNPICIPCEESCYHLSDDTSELERDVDDGLAWRLVDAAESVGGDDTEMQQALARDLMDAALYILRNEGTLSDDEDIHLSAKAARFAARAKALADAK